MGVTIHFSGQLKDNTSLDKVIETAKKYVSKRKWKCKLLNESSKKLKRVKNEEDLDYEGPTKGIAIYPSENCEPIYLEFDKDLYMQEYCKTQFAGIETHLKVLELLHLIQQNFKKLDVIDEAEYWETKNKKKLKKHFDSFFLTLEKVKKDLDKKGITYHSPVIINHRIMDLISDEKKKTSPSLFSRIKNVFSK